MFFLLILLSRRPSSLFLPQVLLAWMSQTVDSSSRMDVSNRGFLPRVADVIAFICAEKNTWTIILIPYSLFY